MRAEYPEEFSEEDSSEPESEPEFEPTFQGQEGVGDYAYGPYHYSDHPKSESSSGSMSRAQAYEVLGLKEGATEDDIQAAFLRLMKHVHPDAGGSEFFATQLNVARDTLLNSHTMIVT
jgi:hypothetical protein